MDLRISELLAMQRELQELHRGDWADVVPSTARAVEKALRRARVVQRLRQENVMTDAAVTS